METFIQNGAVHDLCKEAREDYSMDAEVSKQIIHLCNSDPYRTLSNICDAG